MRINNTSIYQNVDISSIYNDRKKNQLNNLRHDKNSLEVFPTKKYLSKFITEDTTDFKKLDNIKESLLNRNITSEDLTNTIINYMKGVKEG